MKILNLYCGIGGNRKLWGNEHEITAVEYDSKIADKYKALFPNDNVIVADAHQYFIEPSAEIGRHYLWSNFKIPKIELPKDNIGTMMKQYIGKKNHAHSKKLEDRNAVNSELGLHILNCANNTFKQNKLNQIGLFENL
jgi:hypothetical protein